MIFKQFLSLAEATLKSALIYLLLALLFPLLHLSFSTWESFTAVWINWRGAYTLLILALPGAILSVPSLVNQRYRVRKWLKFFHLPIQMTWYGIYCFIIYSFFRWSLMIIHPSLQGAATLKLPLSPLGGSSFEWQALNLIESIYTQVQIFWPEPSLQLYLSMAGLMLYYLLIILFRRMAPQQKTLQQQLSFSLLSTGTIIYYTLPFLL